MKNLIKILIPIIIFGLLTGGICYVLMKGDSNPNKIIQPQDKKEGVEKTDEISNDSERKKYSRQFIKKSESNKEATTKIPTTKEYSALQSVHSQNARRYLRFLLPGEGRLSEESYGGSIVNNAFRQAWPINARLDLSSEQKDKLAEFLLEKDWRSWENLKPSEINKWAKENLSIEQQVGLSQFLKEYNNNQSIIYELAEQRRKQKYGEMDSKEILEKENAEIISILKEGKINGKKIDKKKFNENIKKQLSKSMKIDSIVRPFALLANRIPMTKEQSMSVFDKLEEGVKPPNNPYDYQSTHPDNVDSKVRKDSKWLAEILNENQYKTYIDLFLAEIEMVRFQNKKRR